ncbi:MAG: ABC transporter permease [Bryobacter sp.]|jgi:putative ABC transport system permease protein|nr:ABC transporter permease [Bryobacter sp.]
MRITPAESFRQATTAVWANKFRSGLTILGIVIGITTVVTVASLLTGLRKGIVTFFEEFGPNSVFIKRFSGDPGSQGTPKEQKRRPIRPEYADYLKRLPSIEDVSVSIFVPGIVGGRPLTARVPGFESENVNLSGASENARRVQPREFREGRWFTVEECQRAARVAVIGPLVAEALFPEAKSVLGRTFIVDGAEYIVIGVNELAKGGFFGENGFDRAITIPLETARLRYPQLDNFFLSIKAREGMRDAAVDESRALLRKIRRTPPAEGDDFDLSTPDQIIKQFDQITGLIILVSIAISGLGLLVGGIGVMNIMLVSVTERTKEIGVRKALGARKPDIILQFLTEAVALTGIGGVVGILFAIGVTLLVSAVFPSLPSETPAWAIIAGVSVSVMTGVFFGTWPAVKAARLDPVEALRYE